VRTSSSKKSQNTVLLTNSIPQSKQVINSVKPFSAIMTHNNREELPALTEIRESPIFVTEYSESLTMTVLPGQKDQRIARKPIVERDPHRSMETYSSAMMMLGSLFYLLFALQDARWEVDANDLPQFVVEADDDYTWNAFVGDDYMYDQDGFYVSRYMLMYSIGATCFTAVGVFHFLDFRGFMVAIPMVLGGVLGLTSAILLETQIPLSNKLHLLSMHSYFFYGLVSISSRSTLTKYKYTYLLTDFFFTAGALINLILSYRFVVSHAPSFDVLMVVLEVYASALWAASGMLLIVMKIFLQIQVSTWNNSGEFHVDGS